MSLGKGNEMVDYVTRRCTQCDTVHIQCTKETTVRALLRNYDLRSGIKPCEANANASPAGCQRSATKRLCNDQLCRR